MAPNPTPSILSPNTKAIIALSLLTLAHVTAIFLLGKYHIIAQPHIPTHSIWDLQASIRDWIHGVQAIIPRLYSTYLQLAQYLTASWDSVGQRETAITGLSTLIITCWAFAWLILEDRQTREVVRGSRLARIVLALLISGVVSLVSTMVWGYMPSPMYGLMTGSWSGAWRGNGVKKGDEEDVRGTVNMDPSLENE